MTMSDWNTLILGAYTVGSDDFAFDEAWWACPPFFLSLPVRNEHAVREYNLECSNETPGGA